MIRMRLHQNYIHVQQHNKLINQKKKKKHIIKSFSIILSVNAIKKKEQGHVKDIRFFYTMTFLLYL
jgi:hypothetical protein